MRINQAFAGTHAGAVRKHNQDAVAWLEQLPVLAVADGMGGAGTGEVAARIAIATIERYAEQLREATARVRADRSTEHRLALGNLLDELFNFASRQIAAERNERGKPNMGTTLVLATVIRNFAYVAHVGDSRAYLFREGRLVRLTEDHTVAEFRYRRGRMSLEEYQHSTERRVLYQALGAGVEVEVDLAEIRLVDGDVLLLCSDGLPRALAEERIAELVDPASLTRTVQGLVKAANAAGADDNVSVAAIRVEAEDGDEPIEVVTEVMRQVFLFRNLSQTELLVIAPYLEEVVYDEGATVCSEGDPGNAFYVVVSGFVKISHGLTPLATIAPGGHFGELALTRPVRRSATVRTGSRTRLFLLTRDRFQELVRNKPELGAKLALTLLDTVGERLRDLSERLDVVQKAVRGELR